MSSHHGSTHETRGTPSRSLSGSEPTPAVSSPQHQSLWHCSESSSPDPTSLSHEGTTYDNEENLAPSFYSHIRATYEGTKIGRQEIHADLIDQSRRRPLGPPVDRRLAGWNALPESLSRGRRRHRPVGHLQPPQQRDGNSRSRNRLREALLRPRGRLRAV